MIQKSINLIDKIKTNKIINLSIKIMKDLMMKEQIINMIYQTIYLL
jgi:hypothetical protein